MSDNEVKIGQIWREWDTRYRFKNDEIARKFEVIEMTTKNTEPAAVCRDLTTGKKVIIKTRRLKPTSTGYKLLKDASSTDPT